MSILFAAGMPQDFDSRSGSISMLTSGVSSGTYYRGMMTFSDSSASNHMTKTVSVVPSLFVNAYARGVSALTAGQSILVFAGPSGNIARVSGTGTANLFSVDKWDGSAWVQVSTFTETNTSPYHFAMGVDTGAGGRVRVWTSETLKVDELVDFSGRGEITEVQFRAAAGSPGWGHVIIADHNIATARMAWGSLQTTTPVFDEWVGGRTEINKVGVNDTSYLTSGTAGQRETIRPASPNIDSRIATAVVLNRRARRGSTGPQNVNLAIYRNSTLYEYPTDALTTEFANDQVILATDPSTSAAWDKTDIANCQFGVVSVA